MCVRSVFVLVFMCCVKSRAQWDPSNSAGYPNTPQNPGMLPNGMPPQSGTIPRFTNSPENPGRHPQIMTAENGYSDDSDNPQPQGMLPQYNPSSELPGEHKNPDIYPQGMAAQYDASSRFADSPYNSYMHPQRRPPPYGPTPGLSHEPKNLDMHPQGMLPQYDLSSKFPHSPNNPYNIHPQGMSPKYDTSSGYSDNSNYPHLQPQERPPPNDPSRFPGTPNYPYIIIQPQGRPPQYGPSPGFPNVPENSDINPQGMPPQYHPSPGNPDIREHPDMHPHKMPPPFGPMPDYADDPKPPDLPHRYAPVQHAGLPRKLEVFPLPLENSDHELKFNVSWIPSMGGVANGYSLEVWSLTETDDCQSRNSANSPICYEYNISGNVTWSLIPVLSSTVAETCAIRPGCVYNVKLMSHPWDGHTAANLLVELDECVAEVCSCAHWPRLPAPVVYAQSVTIKDEIYSNISWTLPTPSYPQRLPSAKLGKQSYTVSLGKQIVADTTRSAPWFADIMTHEVKADGFVSEGDTVRSTLFPISRPMELKVKLLARVKLVDERGCVGPVGNATVFDPMELTKSKFSFGVYAILGALIGAWAMGAVFVLSARVVKRVLKSFRPAPVSAPLEPLRRRPAWFPLQLRRESDVTM